MLEVIEVGLKSAVIISEVEPREDLPRIKVLSLGSPPSVFSICLYIAINTHVLIESFHLFFSNDVLLVVILCGAAFSDERYLSISCQYR